MGPGRAERGGGHLPSSSTFFPAGSLERERVETSLRMQDLTGSKAHAEAGGQRPEPPRGRDGHGLRANGRGLPTTQCTGADAELRRARDPEASAGPGVPAGTQGGVGSLPKVLPVLVIACCSTAVARR